MTITFKKTDGNKRTESCSNEMNITLNFEHELKSQIETTNQVLPHELNSKRTQTNPTLILELITQLINKSSNFRLESKYMKSQNRRKYKVILIFGLSLNE